MRLQGNVQRIQADIEALSRFTATPGSGVTRFSFTEEDRQARGYIRDRMLESRLSVSEDAAGTLCGLRGGLENTGPVVMIGSHFDSVKNGGAFDGPAGVVAGLEIARVLDENRVSTRYPLEFVAMVEEEGSRFGGGLFGSRSMAGRVSAEELKTFTDDGGESLESAMQAFGLRPGDIRSAIRKPEQLKAFLELHVEQGPVLERTGTHVGIVETVVGIEQWEVTVTGRPDHAGTTPMDLRADALVAAVEVVRAVRRVAAKAGPGTVATVGRMLVTPGAANIIPGQTVLSVDIRSADEDKIRSVVEAVKKAVAALPLEYPGIVSQMVPRLAVPPVKLSADIARMMEEAGSSCGISTLRMISGAGHDAMVMAGLTEVGLAFVPSRNGRSHCPEEWTDYAQLKNGVDLLLQTALKLAEVIP